MIKQSEDLNRYSQDELILIAEGRLIPKKKTKG